MRRSLPPWTARPVRWLMLRAALLRQAVLMGVRVILVDDANRVLLVRHTYLPGWYVPGGGVEIGETAREAALREAREEVGMEIRGELTLLGLYLHRALGNRDHVAVFIARDFVAQAGAKPDWEIAEKGFFPLDALPDGTTEGTRARLAEAFGGAPLRETW